jgi:hypothetical protein
MADTFKNKHAVLMTEFDRYVREHPRFAAKIPHNAQVILQVTGDPQYNVWIQQLSAQ